MGNLNSLEDRFRYLEELGFKVPEHRLIGIGDIPKIYEEFKEKRNSLNYDIDGLVFSIDNMEKMEVLGFLGERGKPRGQIALKFPTDKCFSKIKDIIFSFKGTQDIGLVAIINPVEILGTTIQRVSLKSYQWVLDHEVGIGSIIEIVRAGDVIPKIERAISKGEQLNIIPQCPYCNSEIKNNGTNLYCSNINCVAKSASQISRFLKNLKVKGLAWKTLIKYIDCGVYLKDFIMKNWEGIEIKLNKDPSISKVIWNKVRKQLEAL
jgi:DNA ligase (NAD+)